MLYSQGCVPIIIHSTRITEKSSTLIDHIYTNNYINVLKSFILLSDVTYHFPILISTNCKAIKQNQSDIYFVRDIKRFKVDSFKKELFDELNTVIEDNTQNVNDLMINFLITFTNTLISMHSSVNKHEKKKTKDKTMDN